MVLEKIQSGGIKSCTREELNVLCDEIRGVICDTVTRRGGHLASNLGAVESTVALFLTFDFPKDKIVFDVGHQCYPYKLLSGRLDRFDTLRQKGGVSGFPKRKESEYDCYDTGHAGTSVSAAIGLAKARDLLHAEYSVIAYIGDGSFNNGLVYEALNSLKILDTKVLIVLNDNGMSISPTVGGMHDILDRINGEAATNEIKLLESFGLDYIGVKDGNDLEEMISAFSEAKESLKNGSVLLHIATKKGKGYEFSEEHPTDTHGVSPSNVGKQREYSEVLGETLCEMAEVDERICVVSAAMKESLGLSAFFENYPDRAFDVGICEENASVLCSSMAAGGLKPYYAIYSTFLQRAFDEIIHDVCGMDLPVTFCIDRAGISGADGETHQGVFDLSYLSMIPNLTIACPKDLGEFKSMLLKSKEFAHPLAIRYPRAGSSAFPCDKKTDLFKWEYLVKEEGNELAILATGERSIALSMKVLDGLRKNGKSADIINARTVKPLDIEMLNALKNKHIITVEDNVLLGGFGSIVNTYVMQSGKQIAVKNYAYRDEFITHGGVSVLQAEYGADWEEILRYADGIL